MRPRAPLVPADPSLAARAALLSASCALLPLLAAQPQTRAAIDLGVSAVRYDGFLPSGAAALTPNFTWNGRRAALALRGTYLRFESGNRSLQGSIVGSTFTRLAPGWRAEASAAAGASAYADFASFWHIIGEVRLQHGSDRQGLGLDATAGRTSFGSSFPSRPVIAMTVTAWGRRDGILLITSASRAFVGDTQYSDIGMTLHGQRGRLGIESALGARLWSRGAGRGLYGDLSGILPLGDRLALVISGGRYPTDPIRGSIAGRFASAALRLHLQRPVRPQVRRPEPSSTALTLHPQEPGYVRLVVHLLEASLVEIAGDFTEWRPVSLTRMPTGDWAVVLPIAQGIHQINMRIDGGPWTAPGGTTRLVGDYDDEIGVFVVP